MRSGDVLRFVRPLVLASRSVATTYSFVPKDGRAGGWALCTVNDSTGELAIQSDWGSWSYRWHTDPQSLGAPTLTAFLGQRGSADYIADKLTSRHTGGDRMCRYQFDSYGTVRELRRMAGERYGYKRITKEECGAFCRDFDKLEGIGNSDRFLEEYFKIDGYEMVCEEPWNVLKDDHTNSYLVLLHAIVPALIEACRTSHDRLMSNLVDAIGVGSTSTIGKDS